VSADQGVVPRVFRVAEYEGEVGKAAATGAREAKVGIW
jgi:hypothetical protein